MSTSDKSFVTAKAASLTMMGPSHKTYNFSKTTPLFPANILDEEWMLDMCVDRSKDVPPMEPRLRVYGSAVQPQNRPVIEKESVFAYNFGYGGPPVVDHKPVHMAKSQEEIEEELLFAAQKAKAIEDQKVANCYLKDGVLESSIPTIIEAVEAFLAENEDISWGVRQSMVRAFIARDPLERKTLGIRVEGLLDTYTSVEELPEETLEESLEDTEELSEE